MQKSYFGRLQQWIYTGERQCFAELLKNKRGYGFLLRHAVAYLGGHGATAPLWPTHENFLQATLYEKGAFLPLSSKNLANLRLPLNVQKQKVFQLSSRPPDPPTRGSAPAHALRARHDPPLPNPKYATGDTVYTSAVPDHGLPTHCVSC